MPKCLSGYVSELLSKVLIHLRVERLYCIIYHLSYTDNLHGGVTVVRDTSSVMGEAREVEWFSGKWKIAGSIGLGLVSLSKTQGSGFEPHCPV